MSYQINLEYQLTGEGNKETILFVHGLGANLSQFEKQHLFFQKKYRVLSLSLRGHGKTMATKELQTEDFVFSMLGQDIITLLDRLKIEKVHFVGNSMGGNIGYELLKSNPKRLMSLLTFGTTAILHKSHTTFKVLQLTYKLLSMTTIAKLSKSSGVSTYAKEKIFEMISHASKSTILHLLPHLEQFDYLSAIEKNPLPILLIKGEKDYEINKILEDTIETLKKAKCCQCITLKRAGHFANLDNPEEFNKIVDDFIGTVTT